MATKWKKCRIIVSFAAFFLGVTLLLTNFFTMLGLLAQADLQAGTDYQKTEEFAGFISGRLETLVSAAAGGEDWHGSLDSYGTAYEAADVYVDSWSTGDFQVADLFRLILNALGITSPDRLYGVNDGGGRRIMTCRQMGRAGSPTGIFIWRSWPPTGMYGLRYFTRASFSIRIWMA